MLPEWIAALPTWMLVGALLGLAASGGVAGLFLLAQRFFPAQTEPPRTEDTESRRSAEIREYLRRIDEPFAEDHVVAGQTVEFYLPTRDVAITFDPRAYYRIDRTETDAVLVEHEFPGVAIGARLPFETPTPYTPDHTAVDPAVAAFDELGLPADASEADVRDAYRQKVKEVHPDQGGSEQDFKRVREAYTTARQHAS